MHPYVTAQLAAQHIAEMQQQAARQRLFRRDRDIAASLRTGEVRIGWLRLSLPHSRSVAARRAGPVVAHEGTAVR